MTNEELREMVDFQVKSTISRYRTTGVVEEGAIGDSLRSLGHYLLAVGGAYVSFISGASAYSMAKMTVLSPAWAALNAAGIGGTIKGITFGMTLNPVPFIAVSVTAAVAFAIFSALMAYQGAEKAKEAEFKLLLDVTEQRDKEFARVSKKIAAIPQDLPKEEYAERLKKLMATEGKKLKQLDKKQVQLAHRIDKWLESIDGSKLDATGREQLRDMRRIVASAKTAGLTTDENLAIEHIR